MVAFPILNNSLKHKYFDTSPIFTNLEGAFYGEMTDHNLSNLSDEKLFALVKRGNELAFDALFTRHWKNLYRTVASFLSDKAAAEDIVQDIFFRLWTRRQVIETDNIAAYLFKAAKLQSYRQLRNKKITAGVLERANNLAFAYDTENQINFSQVQEHYQACLESMPEKTRLVFKMSRIENCSHQEIAEALGITVKTVEYHISNALRLLRRHMTEFISMLFFLHI